MGRLLLVCRLAARDLRRRPAEAVLLLLAIAAAATTLTLGLALTGVTSQPYQQTRAATAGPDTVASFLNLGQPVRLATGLSELESLVRAAGVTGHTGPYPVAWAVLRAGGRRAGVIAEGRDLAPAAIDQPKVTQGSWIRDGGVVIERSFAAALGVSAGDRVTLNGRTFRVAGIAVSAADAPYPHADFATSGGPFPSQDTGLVWLTRAAARSLATRALPLSYLLNLKLADPASANAFVLAHSSGRTSALGLSSWAGISQEDGNIMRIGQRALLVGSSLLNLLALASVAVLAGGRMAEQTRRVGLLKAVGATPKLVAAVLLAEHLAVALAAAAIGLLAGWLAAPLLSSPGAGLVGTPGAPSLTAATAAWVIALALTVAILATFVPAVRAARASTVAALADAARHPARRRAWLIAVSARLPAPLLLGLRLAARRPRRLLLSAASVAITVMTLVAVLTVHAHQAQQQSGSGFFVAVNPQYQRVDQVLLVVTVVLAVLAAVNTIFITWATVLDTRRPAAVARALGVTPLQVSAGLSVVQLLPALPAAVIGIPAGIGLVVAASHGGTLTIPPAWSLMVVLLAVFLVLAGLIAVPARIGARRPPADILQSERA
jgi:putative ABC transport system permease protein